MAALSLLRQSKVLALLAAELDNLRWIPQPIWQKKTADSQVSHSMTSTWQMNLYALTHTHTILQTTAIFSCGNKVK